MLGLVFLHFGFRNRHPKTLAANLFIITFKENVRDSHFVLARPLSHGMTDQSFE